MRELAHPTNAVATSTTPNDFLKQPFKKLPTSRRNKRHVLNRFERSTFGIIMLQVKKPLLSRAKNQPCATAPTMRITMLDAPASNQKITTFQSVMIVPCTSATLRPDNVAGITCAV